jgi:23S rRNA U2552 (ribose-2'-O)-methylase RlmE/FtsJ
MEIEIKNNIYYIPIEIKIEISDDIEEYILYDDLYEKLKNTKNNIDNYNITKWNKTKKLCNDYDAIFISSYSNFNISKYLPVSRAYFKFIEITERYNLLNDNNMVVSCISEAPGGFIESFLNKRKNKYMDNIYGVTLNNYNKKIPGWNKLYSIIQKINNREYRNNIHLLYSDIYNINNIKKYCKIFNEKKADLVTADGGFDYSIDFNSQEQLSYRIIFCEILIALCTQKKGGSFFCKFFDIFSILSINYIYLLKCCYKHVYIFKPLTSRPANSEKYIVCKDFLDNIDPSYIKKMFGIVEAWELLEQSNNNLIFNLFNDDPPISFINHIQEFCNTLIDNQCNNINQIIEYIDKPPPKYFYNKIIKEQREKSLEWCKKYSVSFN